MTGKVKTSYPLLKDIFNVFMHRGKNSTIQLNAATQEQQESCTVERQFFVVAAAIWLFV